MTIVFKEDTHQYFVDGKEYPSVTTILHSLNDFSFVNKDLLERAAKFGTAVHYATELYDSNTLDLDTLDPTLMPYVDAWDQFLNAYEPEIISCEQRVASMYGYAGTLDRYVKIDGQRIIIDIKSGSVVPKYTGLQLSAYEQAITEGGGRVDKRYVVHLQPYKYKVIPFNNKVDFITFKSALNLYRWGQQNG
jgi:hypothetical protein